MGCIITKNKVDGHKYYNKNESLPSTSMLLTILQQPYLLSNFKIYVEEKWKPLIKDDDPFNMNYRLHAKDIALNSIEFWLDCRDFSMIQKSHFKTYRACYIFEKYLMHGATKHVPISANVIDECSEAIFGTMEITSAIFNNACSEALDFLVSEVYPSFENASSSLISRGSGMIGVVKDSINHIRRGSLSSPDAGQLKNILMKILYDHEYLHAFKIYLAQENAEIFLYSYHEIVEIRERLTHLIDTSEDSELNLSIFMYYINSFYDTYLRMGAQFKINLPNAVRGDFMMKLSLLQAADVDVLKIIEEDTFNTLIRMYLNTFLVSAEYRQVVRAGRNSVLVMASNLHDPIAVDEKIERKKSLMMTNDNDNVDADALKEMKSYLLSGHDELFTHFLETRSKLSYMQFSQSVLRFQESSYSNEMDRAIDCSNIFDRYISRNAEDYVAVPEDIKLKITKNQFRGSQLLFSEALDWVLDILFTSYWVPFKNEINEQLKLKMEEEERNIKADSSNSDSSIESTRESMMEEKKDELTVVKGSQKNKIAPITDGILSKFIPQTQRLSFNGDSRRVSNWDRRKSLRSIGRRNSIGAPKIADSADTEQIIRKHKFGLSYRKIESRSAKPSQCVKDVLEHSQCCSIFKEFLERENGAQTLLFLLEVEEYRRIPQVSYQLVRARKVFNKFIHSLSIMPLPISTSVRDEIEENMRNDLFLPVLFKKATLQIHDYIEKVQFPKFQQSKEMDIVINILSQEAGVTSKTVVRRRSSIALQSLEEAQVMNLKTILQYQISTRFFKDFCVRTYVNESLFFWLDAENYMNLPGSDYMKRTAHKICRKYIVDDARMQINISSSTKQEILKAMDRPHRMLFKKAQEDIFKLLEHDTFPKFLSSPEAAQLNETLCKTTTETSAFSKISSFRLNLAR